MSEAGDNGLELLRYFNGAAAIDKSMTSASTSLARFRQWAKEFPDTAVPAHTLVLALTDSVASRTRGGVTRCASLRRGEIGFLPARSYGSWSFAGGERQFLHVYLSDAELSAAAEHRGLSTPSFLQEHMLLTDPVMTWLASEANASLDQPDCSRMYVEGLTAAVAHRLLQLCSAIDAPKVVKGGLSPKKLNHVCEHLVGRLVEDVALAELAAIADLTPHHFCRAFKQSTGLSPHSFLTARRIERAQELMLAHPAMSLAEIAQTCGFADQAHFTRTFTRHCGTSPGRWRRERMG